MNSLLLLRTLLIVWLLPVFASAAVADQVKQLKITVLSTMLTELRGVGEWGFAALVEADGETILFDTGARPDTVLSNALELGVSLEDVSTVVLSHNHWDHTGGLVTLRKILKRQNPSAMQTLHVGEGIFLPRELDPQAKQAMSGLPGEYLVDVGVVKKEFEALGGVIKVHGEPFELQPGVWLTGPVPRIHPEKNWTPFSRIVQGESREEDTIPEDQALVIATPDGIVVLTGCGHAGIVNIMEYARTIVPEQPLHAALGGFHLVGATPEEVRWTAGRMKAFGVDTVMGAHCTGINPVADLRQAGHYDRRSFVVGSVGATFTLGEGIRHGPMTN